MIGSPFSKAKNKEHINFREAYVVFWTIMVDPIKNKAQYLGLFKTGLLAYCVEGRTVSSGHAIFVPLNNCPDGFFSQ